MKKIYLFIISILTLCLFLPIIDNSKIYSSTNLGFWSDDFSTNFYGEGTDESPYLISTAQELAGLAYLVNNNQGSYSSATYHITNDIDLQGKDWISIGNGESKVFSGKINGNNHHIKNMTVIATPGGYASFIGYSIGARVENLIFDEPKLFGNECFTGTVLGNDTGSFINYVLVNNLTIDVFNSLYCGGLVGWTSGNIEHVYCSGQIEVDGNSNDEFNVGGIAGFFAGTYVHYAINYANINCLEGEYLVYAGGILGKAGGAISYGEGNVRVSYNRGNISALASKGAYAAGICAQNYYINKTYCNGSIYGLTKSYGLTNNGGGQDSAYYLNNIPSNIGDEDISFSCTLEELKKFEIVGTEEYYDKGIEIINNGLPILKWYYWMLQV